MALDETYIQEAADRVMIQDLLGRYAFAADYGTGNPESWAALFIEDGIFEIPKISMVVRGRPALTKFMDGIHRTVPGIHHVMSNYSSMLKVIGRKVNVNLTSLCFDRRQSITIFMGGMRMTMYVLKDAGL